MIGKKRVVILLLLVLLISLVPAVAEFKWGQSGTTSYGGQQTPVGIDRVNSLRQSQRGETNIFATAFKPLGMFAEAVTIPYVFQGLFWALFFFLILSTVKEGFLRTGLFKGKGDGKLSRAGNVAAFCFAAMATIGTIYNVGFGGGTVEQTNAYLASLIGGWLMLAASALIVLISIRASKGEIFGIDSKKLFGFLSTFIVSGFALNYTTMATEQIVVDILSFAMAGSLIGLIWLIGSRTLGTSQQRGAAGRHARGFFRGAGRFGRGAAGYAGRGVRGAWRWGRRNIGGVGYERDVEDIMEVDYAEALNLLSQLGKREVLCINELENLQEKKCDFYEKMTHYWGAHGKKYKKVERLLRRKLPGYVRREITLTKSILNCSQATVKQIQIIYRVHKGRNEEPLSQEAAERLSRIFSEEKSGIMSSAQRLLSELEIEIEGLPKRGQTWNFVKKFEERLKAHIEKQTQEIQEIKEELRRIIEDIEWTEEEAEETKEEEKTEETKEEKERNEDIITINVGGKEEQLQKVVLVNEGDSNDTIVVDIRGIKDSDTKEEINHLQDLKSGIGKSHYDQKLRESWEALQKLIRGENLSSSDIASAIQHYRFAEEFCELSEGERRNIDLIIHALENVR